MSKVLIVEDHKPTANLLRDYIRVFFPKWEYAIAASGHDAIEKAVAESPDAIIVDIALPDGVDGIHVIQAVYAAGRRPGVILVTALDNKAVGHAKPGAPWVDQLTDDERKLVTAFFEKTKYRWRDFLLAIAKAARQDPPANLDMLEE
jgi:CheY-like chemotaxis protein